MCLFFVSVYLSFPLSLILCFFFQVSLAIGEPIDAPVLTHSQEKDGLVEEKKAFSVAVEALHKVYSVISQSLPLLSNIIRHLLLCVIVGVSIANTNFI